MRLKNIIINLSVNPFRNMILRSKEIDKDRKSFYLVLTKDLIKKVNNQ